MSCVGVLNAQATLDEYAIAQTKNPSVARTLRLRLP
jgi:hypothetical protein